MGVHDGHRQRLREEFVAHGDDFHDHQLLELLLCYAIPRGDVNALAHTLLLKFGSLDGVLDALPEALEQVPGIGKNSAVLLKLIPKLAGRYLDRRVSLGAILTSSTDFRDFLRPYFRLGTRNEMAYLLCLDAKRKALGCHKLGEGVVNATDIAPRKILELALAQNATGVVLAHNHLSGLALPSNADLTTTRKLYRLLGDVGVELYDHLIFADDDMVSLRESGFFVSCERE